MAREAGFGRKKCNYTRTGRAYQMSVYLRNFLRFLLIILIQGRVAKSDILAMVESAGRVSGVCALSVSAFYPFVAVRNAYLAAAAAGFCHRPYR